MRWLIVFFIGVLVSPQVFADAGIPVLSVETNQNGNQQYSVTLQVLGLMTLLTFLPAIVMMMTSFIRVTVVFAILRQALGMQQTPSNQILIGLSLFLTFFIMSPIIERVNQEAVQPYINETMDATTALDAASVPFSQFMLEQTRESDLILFMDLSGTEQLEEGQLPPFKVLVPLLSSVNLKQPFKLVFYFLYHF